MRRGRRLRCIDVAVRGWRMTGNARSAQCRGQRTGSRADCLDGREAVADSAATAEPARFGAGAQPDWSEGDRGRELVRAANLDLQAIRAHYRLGGWLGARYQWVAAEPHYLLVIDSAADLQFDQLRHLATSGLAHCHLFQGKWDSALELASAVLAADQSLIGRGSALQVVGRIRARRGEAGAANVLDEALALAQAGGAPDRIGLVRAARAESAWLRGDRAAVITDTAAATGLIGGPGRAWWEAELAYWRWRAGAEAWPQAVMATPFAWQISGECERGALAWDELGCPYEAARARAEGSSEAALRLAMVSFDQLGAGPALREARRQWRVLGLPGMPRGPNRSTRAHPAQLTPRQAQILGLVVDGCGNRVIASRLFLSKRTVEAHVCTLFTKLGVNCREEAARLARERGLVTVSPGVPGPLAASAPVDGFGGYAPPMPKLR